MDEIKIANYSLITLLIIAFAAFVYTCNIINFNSCDNTNNLKVIAGFKA